jgi:hypothetical protein
MGKKIIVFTESQVKKIISEQMQGVQLMSVLSSNPALLSFVGKDNSKELYISLRNPKTGQVIPNSTYKYNLSAEYTKLGIGFDVVIRALSRNNTGDLIGHAKPASMAGKLAMRAIPKQFKTEDGWLMIKVPNTKITQAINQLKQNQGKTAEVDAGNGVKINLQLV